MNKLGQAKRAFRGPHYNVLMSLIITKGCVRLCADAQCSPKPNQLPPCTSPPYPTNGLGSFFHVFGTHLVIQVYLNMFRSAPVFFSAFGVSRVLDHDTNERKWGCEIKDWAQWRLWTAKIWLDSRNEVLPPCSSSLPVMFSLILWSDMERNRSGPKTQFEQTLWHSQCQDKSDFADPWLCFGV